ncbi:unnamed protein product [Protopolystoma xenopodis]|uniref:Uncharacterized protein n=1 Tax=Protopolystoma xenopodis TaxID=117903 RepID=A0A448X0R2_9PLAT|nr:unnamed protein product [Protopolystoma xenopodis]
MSLELQKGIVYKSLPSGLCMRESLRLSKTGPYKNRKEAISANLGLFPEGVVWNVMPKRLQNTDEISHFVATVDGFTLMNTVFQGPHLITLFAKLVGLSCF